TYTVRISTNQYWMRRAGAYFFLFVQDSEGAKLPGTGFNPDSTVNLIRFLVPTDEGRKLIDRLDAGQMYEAAFASRSNAKEPSLAKACSILAGSALSKLSMPPRRANGARTFEPQLGLMAHSKLQERIFQNVSDSMEFGNCTAVDCRPSFGLGP